ncbi:MAG: hypothetical protein KDA75_08815 [Planctomycetaceae bacterium]|nr:hypothetical protein [Planctomycetaceae bacterium]
MTGYTVHTGSSTKFAAGWDQIFKGGAKKGSAKQTAGKKQPTTAKEKKPARKAKQS